MVRAEPLALNVKRDPNRFASELVPFGRMLLLSAGTSSLSVAVCNVPADQERLVDDLSDRTGAMLVDAASGPLETFFDELAPRIASDAPSALFVVGVADSSPYRQWMNRSREKWRRHFAGPVIFWMTTAVADAMSRGAPDLWSWVSHEFDFTRSDDPEQSASLSAADGSERYGLWANRSKAAKLERLDELGKRLAEVGEDWLHRPGLMSAVESWWLERLSMLASLGRSDEMEGYLEALLERDGIRGRFRCQIMMIRSRRKAEAGDFAAAFRDLERAESEIVVAEPDDEHAWAIVRGRIADIHETRGELDEALRIRRDEQVPVFERLDDVRALTIARAQIADIHQARGELSEALRIRQEEEGPVFEQFEDVRSLTITRKDRQHSREARRAG